MRPAPGAQNGTARTVPWSRRFARPAPGPLATWPATPDSVADARREVVLLARAAGASDEAQADIELAVSEACTNAVLHAFAASGVRGSTFTVSTGIRGGLFSVWVSDDGRGIAPDAPSPGLGVGLTVMASVSRSLHLGVLDDGRTQVEMRFALS
jgi:serine/threonine-protein kinase RsbW/stage II sporulation protein AB (anti-sigma F factor)